jgi:hypothetical protein
VPHVSRIVLSEAGRSVRLHSAGGLREKRALWSNADTETCGAPLFGNPLFLVVQRLVARGDRRVDNGFTVPIEVRVAYGSDRGAGRVTDQRPGPAEGGLCPLLIARYVGMR